MRESVPTVVADLLFIIFPSAVMFTTSRIPRCSYGDDGLKAWAAPWLVATPNSRALLYCRSVSLCVSLTCPGLNMLRRGDNLRYHESHRVFEQSTLTPHPQVGVISSCSR